MSVLISILISILIVVLLWQTVGLVMDVRKTMEKND